VDPFVDELVERAAERYAGLFDPEELAEMKDEVRMFLTAHPRASRIVDRARPRPGKRRSAKDEIPGIAPVPVDEPEDKAGGEDPR
jgi:hypothetical protein